MKARSRRGENPLVPDAMLERMYELTRRLRALSQRSAAASAAARYSPGAEVCRASSLLSLSAGDLVSDLPEAQVLPPALFSKPMPGAKKTALQPHGSPRWLPGSAAGLDRFFLAMGAAGALQAQATGQLLLLYAQAAELTATGWKRALGLAGASRLPVIFVVLPSSGTTRQGALSDRAQGWGVPGMPVDAADAVALFRVLQESVLRARSGDGPALIECLRWAPGSGALEASDGLMELRQVLRSRGLLSRQRSRRRP